MHPLNPLIDAAFTKNKSSHQLDQRRAKTINSDILKSQSLASRVWCDKKLSSKFKVKLYKIVVRPFLLYRVKC